MKIILEHSGIKMEITYNNDGYLEHVMNINTGHYMMIESKTEGSGYKIERDNYLMSMDVCDARYVRIMDIDLFIPRLIFIENKHKLDLF